MKKRNFSEHTLIEEVTEASRKALEISRGVQIGRYIKMIRSNLGMSQQVLAKRADVPQSTISRIEKESRDANFSTINKLLDALNCDLLILPMMRDSLEETRLRQAKIKAKAHIDYLKGTMSLEQQKPDSRFLDKLFNQEVERLLHGNDRELWDT